MKKYLLFDLDGTLTDPKLGITTCVQYALQSFGIEEPDLDKLEPFIGPPLSDSFMEFYGMDENQAKEAVAKYRERFQDKGLFENEVYDGIPHMLRTLKKNGMVLAVASSKPQVFVERILEHFHLRKYFQVIVGSELDGSRSNKDEVVQEALGQLFGGEQVQREAVYMIGDRKFDVEGARIQHIESVAVTYGYGSLEELKESKADYIVRSVRELEDFLLRDACGEDTEEEKRRGVLRGIYGIFFSYLVFEVVRGIVPYFVKVFVERIMDKAVPAVPATTLGFFCAGLVLLPYAKGLIVRTAKDTKLNHLRQDDVRSYLLLVGALFGAVIGLNLLFELTRFVFVSDAYQETSSAQYSTSFLMGLVAYGLVAPVAEELLFRGIFHNSLRRLLRKSTAIFFSSALFGLYHMNLVQGLYGFLMGCLIAYTYEYYGFFGMAVAAHMIANILAFCLSYLPVGGTFFVSWPVCAFCLSFACVCLWQMNALKGGS